MAKRPKSDAKQSPARKVIDLSPHRITGVLTLPGLEVYPNQHESDLERRGLRLISLCHDVHMIKSQPISLDLSALGLKRKSYTPDASIRVESQEVYVEFKALEWLVRPKAYEELKGIGTYFRTTRQQYFIVTDDQLNVEPRRTNATLLRRFLTSPVSEARRICIQDALVDGPKRIKDLLGTSDASGMLRDIYALIAQRYVCFDWNRSLDIENEVSLPGRPFRGLTFECIVNSGRFADLLQQVAMGREPQDQRLLAAARGQDWSIPDTNGWGFVDALPGGTYTGRFRYPGSISLDTRQQGDTESSVISDEAKVNTAFDSVEGEQ